MKYSEIKIIEEKEKKQDENYTVIVVYIDGQKYQITDIKQKHLDAPTFKDAILKMAKKKYPNKEFKEFYIVGEDGRKVDGAGFSITDDDEPAPLEVPVPGETTNNPEEDEEQLTVIATIDTVSNKIVQYKRWLADDSKTKFTKDRRANDFNKDRLKELNVIETGENAGALVDPTTGTAVGAISGTPMEKKINEYMQSNPNMPKMVGVVSIGGSSAGESGESGEEGEDGLTAGQKGSAPEIAKEVRGAIKGIGTSEGRLFTALKRIQSKAHLHEVIMRYKEIYNRNFANDIKNEFRWDPKNNENLVRELNDIMMPLGYKLEPISKDLGRQMTYRWIIWGA